MNTNLLLRSGRTFAYLKPILVLLLFSIFGLEATHANSWIFSSGNNETVNLNGNTNVNKIVVTNGTSLTINGPAFQYTIVTISGDGTAGNDDFYVESGSSVTFVGGMFATFIVQYSGSGNQTNIEGTLTFEHAGTVGGTSIFKNNNSGQNTTTVSGTIQVNDRARIDAAAGALTFASGGQYIHNTQRTGNKIPLASWGTGSLCKVIGFTNEPDPPADIGQTYFDFEWDCPAQTANTSFAGAQPTFLGTFKVSNTGSGILRLNHTSNTVTINCAHFEQGGAMSSWPKVRAIHI